MVDPGTLAALQIFQEERHASQMGIGTSKEGFSVYGIMQRCVTQMVGRARGAAGWAVMGGGGAGLLPGGGLRACTCVCVRVRVCLPRRRIARARAGTKGLPRGPCTSSPPLPWPHAHRPTARPSTQGRRLMRMWFLRPVVNIDTINDRLDAVELLVHAPDLCTMLREQLKQVRGRGSSGGRRVAAGVAGACAWLREQL